MELLYAIPLGLTLSFAAGPIFFVLIETSINKGRTKALLLDLGAVTADALFIALAYYGSQAFLSYLQTNFWLVLLSGLAIVAFGVYYVLRSRRSGQLQQKLEIRRRRFFFVKGFLLNFLNVGVLFFWITSTVAVGSLVDNDPRRLLVFYGATLATYLLINLLKIYFAHRFKAYLGGRRMQIIEKLMGLGLIGFGVFIVVRHFL
jgi:threonine/homoserine/homoserine lactone efflux protein